jgi:regulatory protein
MERAGYAAADIADTLDTLRDRRYVDDLEFALGFARAARTHKHWGPLRIAHGLRKRGLADSHIQEALADAFPEGEAKTAARALERFQRSDRRRGTPRERKASAYRHFQRRRDP